MEWDGGWVFNDGRVGAIWGYDFLESRENGPPLKNRSFLSFFPCFVCFWLHLQKKCSLMLPTTLGNLPSKRGSWITVRKVHLTPFKRDAYIRTPSFSFRNSFLNQVHCFVAYSGIGPAVTPRTATSCPGDVDFWIQDHIFGLCRGLHSMELRSGKRTD
jgi:hypothetical protein